jgi:hypothetical protein
VSAHSIPKYDEKWDDEKWDDENDNDDGEVGAEDDRDASAIDRFI